MNLFEEFGIREVANVCLYSIKLDKNDNEIYIPVLYLDTLKVSTVEENVSTSYSEGGKGNPKLISWDYGRDITVTLEDALFTPASQSMNWGSKLGRKGLTLYLRYFFDRNTDGGVPDTCLRTAKLHIDNFSNFMVIPDRWNNNVGNTSIYCWLVDGRIISDNDDKRVVFKDLLLFYRQQTQNWYFFNGKGYKQVLDTEHPEEYDVYRPENYGINYQYGQHVFDWIKENYKSEVEPMANSTAAAWAKEDYNREESGVFFLTQNLYIDGYRKGCARDKKYSELMGLEPDAILKRKYLPYRFFANVGVSYNSNILPPELAIYALDTAHENVVLIDRMDKICADKTFCINTDANLIHFQCMNLELYSNTPLTTYLDPLTMSPFEPNAYEFYKRNGQRVTGNLRIVERGQMYYKYSREKAHENKSLGGQIIIDPVHYPGVYRLVGETVARDRYGIDSNYRFEIPLCKLHPTNKLNLAASGDPTVFTMKLTALRREDGVMMKLTAYDLINEEPFADKKINEIPAVNPEPVPVSYGGEMFTKFDYEIEVENRDIAPALINNDYTPGHEDISYGFLKTEDLEDDQRVGSKFSGTVDMFSIDGTVKGKQEFVNVELAPDDFTATITGSDV